MEFLWLPRALTFVVLTLFSCKLFLWRRKLGKLPPGPPKLPIIENLHNMPTGLDWVKFKELGEKYNSDIIHLSALGNSIIVLNSYKVAQDLLDSRSGIYSSRQASVMLGELCGMTPGPSFAIAPYGDLWRKSRRIFNKHLGSSNTAINLPRERFYVYRFLCHLLEEPHDIHQHIVHLLGSLTIAMTYGIKARPKHDPYIDSAEKTAHYTNDIAVCLWMVDIVPHLKYLPSWFPGATFQGIAAECRRRLFDSRDMLFGAAKKNMETAECTPSFVSEALQDLDGKSDVEEEEDLVKDVAAMVYSESAAIPGAADTTTVALSTFFLAMVLYPEVQKKAQDELDGMLGGRLPEQEDISDLPYLNALVLEVLRWEPTVPCALPHATTLDDVYNGYYIPKGSIVVPNSWAMLTDPEVYPDPLELKPERFLKDGKLDESIRSPLDIAFGYGRRICPGRHIAMSTLKMTVASVLSTMDIVKKTDIDGKVVEPTRQFTQTLVRRPLDISCVVQPRSEFAVQTITNWLVMEGNSPP